MVDRPNVPNAAEQRLFSGAFTTTDEIPTMAYRSHPAAAQTNFAIFSTQAGTLDIDYLMSDGNWREVVANQAVLANDLVVVSFSFRVPVMRGRFTPSAAPGSVTIDANYGGQAQPG